MKTAFLKWSSRAFLFAGILSFTVACSDDDDDNNNNNPQNKTSIADVASNDPELSTLLAALQATGLDAVVDDDNANLTVFAPTNQAFDALLVALGVTDLNGLVSELGAEAVTEILKYHVIGTEVMSSAINDGYVTTLGENARGEMMSMYISTNGGVIINGSAASVIAADIDADNGVMHKVNAVILPPTVAGLVASNRNYACLLAAVQAADASVLITLNDESLALTVFGPDNDAFADALTELGLADLNELVSTLGQSGVTNVLLYHVLTDEITSSEVSTGTDIGTALAGFNIDITVGMDGSVTLTDELGRMATVTMVDIQGSNGVIHMIDKVILPQ